MDSVGSRCRSSGRFTAPARSWPCSGSFAAVAEPEPPLVSGVTPSLTQARFIEQTIAGVAAQDYPRIEHLVVDGGSTDGTVEVLRRHPELRWVSEVDGGQADAISKG